MWGMQVQHSGLLPTCCLWAHGIQSITGQDNQHDTRQHRFLNLALQESRAGNQFNNSIAFGKAPQGETACWPEASLGAGEGGVFRAFGRPMARATWA